LIVNNLINNQLQKEQISDKALLASKMLWLTENTAFC